MTHFRSFRGTFA